MAKIPVLEPAAKYFLQVCFNWEIANPKLTKEYLISAYRSSCNGTLWPVGHLLHFVVSRLVVSAISANIFSL